MIILTYDVGTTGVKTCLFSLERRRPTGPLLQILDSSFAEYSLRILPNGGRSRIRRNGGPPLPNDTTVADRRPEECSQIAGISFCAQAQSLVLLDKAARPVRPSMSYMDQRSGAVRRAHSGRGPKIAGAGIPFLLQSLYHTGVVAGSDKDPVWKYVWVKENEPEVYAGIHKWLDVKDALVAKMTGRLPGRDSALPA